MNTQAIEKLSDIIKRADRERLKQFVRDFASYTAGIGNLTVMWDFHHSLIRIGLTKRAWFKVIYHELKGEGRSPGLAGLFDGGEAYTLEWKIEGRYRRFKNDGNDYFRLFFHPEEDVEGHLIHDDTYDTKIVSDGLYHAIEWLSSQISASYSTNRLIQKVIESLIGALEDCDAEQEMLKNCREALLAIRIINDEPIDYQEIRDAEYVQRLWDHYSIAHSKCPSNDDWNDYAVQVFQKYWLTIHPRNNILSTVKPDEDNEIIRRIDDIIYDGRFCYYKPMPEPDAELPAPNVHQIAVKNNALIMWLEDLVKWHWMTHKCALEAVVGIIEDIEKECADTMATPQNCKAINNDDLASRFFDSWAKRIESLREALIERF